MKSTSFRRKRPMRRPNTNGPAVSGPPRVGGPPTWEGVTYSRVPPGIYSAVAVRVQGPVWLKYGRWSALVEFELLGETDTVRVCAFFPMGNHPTRTTIGRHSNYFQAWAIANGELPRQGQVLELEVFLEGQVFEIEVDDNRVDSAGLEKTDAEVYSVVRRVLSATRPNLPIRNQSIKNQPNHAISQSGNQPIKVGQ
jgi:hypothetical protein